MERFDTTETISQVRSKLERAWHFLSGQTREFSYLGRDAEPLKFTDFSFFMPLTSQDRSRCGGVGVLLGRADATAVAAHMFGVQPDAVKDADLRDACSEVCNVLCDCVASQFDDGTPVGLGFPSLASAEQYATIAAQSQVRAVFQASFAQQHVFVVLYDSPNGSCA